MNKNNPSGDIFIKIFFYILLITPLLAYFYIVWLSLPNTILFWYEMYILFFGIVFILRHKIIYIPNYTWLILGYAVYRAIMVQFNYTGGFFRYFYDTTHYFSTVLLIIIIYNTKFSDSFIKRSISIFKITAMLAVAASIIQVFHPNFLNAFKYLADNSTTQSVVDLYQVRRLAIFGFIDLNELGLSFIPFSSVIIGYLIHNRLKSFIYLIISVGIVALVSNNRYVIVGFLIMTLQYSFYNKSKFIGYIKFIFFSIILILIFYYILNIVGYNLLDWYNKRLFAEGSVEQTTRWKAWGNFIHFFPKYFLWGTGVLNAPEIERASARIGSSQIHVGYLAHLVSFGIVGSFFYFGFLLMLIKSLLKTAKLTNYWGSFFAFLIFLWAQTTLVYHTIFFTGLIFALIFNKYYYDKYREYIGQTIESVVKLEYDKINI